MELQNSHISTAVSNAQATSSLLDMHGAAHGEEMEATANVASLEHTNENVVSLCKDVKHRQRQLQHTTSQKLAQAAQSFSDTTQKMAHATSSFSVHSTNSESSVESLKGLANATDLSFVSLKKNNNIENEFHQFKQLLQELQQNKTRVLAERQRHDSLQLQVKTATHTLKETTSLLLNEQKSAQTNRTEMEIVQLAMDGATTTLNSSNSSLSVLKTDHDALVATYQSNATTLAQKEDLIRNETQQLKESKIILQQNNAIETNTNELIFLEKNMQGINEKIIQTQQVIDGNACKFEPTHPHTHTQSEQRVLGNRHLRNLQVEYGWDFVFFCYIFVTFV